MAFAYKIDAQEFSERQMKPRRSYAAECFVAFELVAQLALLVPALGAARQLVRASAFMASPLMSMVCGVRGRRHPAGGAAILVIIVISLSILNPMRNSWLAACAQVVLYAAIVAPLFWVPSLRLDRNTWYRVLVILWAFHTLSAATAILQVYFPGHFTPNVSSAVISHGWWYVNALTIITNTHEKVFRPMGLTDAPGAAAYAGFYAVSIGLLLLVCEKRTWFRVLYAASMSVGLAVIALSQVRTIAVMTVICISAFLVLLQVRNTFLSGRRARSGERIAKVRLALAAAAVSAMLILGLILALSLARASVSKRLATLVGNDPGQVYYTNRGVFLEKTVEELLPEYPLGAGPGRWGMIFRYFGDQSNLENPSIWAEIQWTGWLLDGGIPLILGYVFAISLAFGFSLKAALGRNARDVGVFGAFVFAYDLGALAQTFDSPFFMGTDGMLFWFINAMLYATMLQWSRQAVRRLHS